MIRFLLIALLSLLVHPADAVTLEMNGTFTQGGIIMGRTDPGVKLTLDGRPVRVSADGIFVRSPWSGRSIPTGRISLKALSGLQGAGSPGYMAVSVS